VRSKLVTCTLALAVILGACGDGDDSDGAQTSNDDAESTETTAAADQAAGNAFVQAGQTDLGEVLTDAEGLTLYGFTNDTDGQPTCEDDCANAWPPVLVEGSELPEGLDPAVFSVVQRSDGTSQLKAGEWPLYTFAGDEAPGDTNGQGSGGIWFAVSPTGQLLQDGAGGAGAEGGSSSTETTDTTESDDSGGGYDY
jgi:predicted lipoprotein with Yx(FWY)xxD motif